MFTSRPETVQIDVSAEVKVRAKPEEEAAPEFFAEPPYVPAVKVGNVMVCEALATVRV
jgi:hypothetical protein